jgi:hypothetical protein
MKNLFYLTLFSLVLVSCDSNERNIKKTFNRLNSGETSAASKYIWPKDHKNLFTFEQRFLSENEFYAGLGNNRFGVSQNHVFQSHTYAIEWRYEAL